jgi:gluconolactonase
MPGATLMTHDPLYTSQQLTPDHVFTGGIEGPACDRDGNVYAINFRRQGTIGMVRPDGTGTVFVDLPTGSTGNGLRFSPDHTTLFVADYTGHNILAINMATRTIRIHAHDARFHQPNDIAITGDGVIFASDPCWADASGQIWRVDPSGRCVLLERGMGTTNGIEVGPGDRTLYVNETVQRRIWAYDLAADGAIGNKRVLHQFKDWALDGMRCDQAGNLFVTRYGKGAIAQIAPDGTLVREIGLRGRNCTNLSFGGSDGRTCYVTIADTGAIESFRAELPGREA